MKPTLPEDRELEKMGSEVSERYRAGAQDEPPARLDATIQAAARREVEQPRFPGAGRARQGTAAAFP